MRRSALSLIGLLLFLIVPLHAATTTTFLQTNSDPTDGTSFTFAGENLGTASSDRWILAGVGCRASGATTFTIDSVTVQGLSATVIQATHAATNATLAGLARVNVPTGTAGDVVVTVNRTSLRCLISLSATTGEASLTLSDSGTSTASPPAYALDVPAGGVGVGVVVNGGIQPFTWSNLTERSDFNHATETTTRLSMAHDDFGTVQTDLAVQATTTYTEPVGVFASFGAPPAGGGPPQTLRTLLGVR